ncbi:hypothetical protein [Evansella tamaricis]|uniref:Yip1 domain-containing protein n=1 Tax=Evansella tamaricis TaxID=2069301 RepID=A0ABS6JIY4_9BACI|nr:hypothetical protein [Evansella tamaricis]MBU9713642.1 hypothetical protein [Evansella tamaricis]
MSEQPEQEEVQEVPQDSKDTLNYFQYLIQTIKKPDDFLGEDDKGYQLFGIINMVLLLFLIIFSFFIQRIVLFTGSGWFARGFLDSIKLGISYAIPLALVVVLMNWYANKNGSKRNVAYFFERLGALLTLPCILLVLSIPLNLLEITLHTWFRTISYSFIYIAIFMICYLFVSPKNLKVASVFLLGFYFTYRLIYYIL